MFRLESDSIGTLEIPSNAYYGVQSLRGANNFNISGNLMNKNFIYNINPKYSIISVGKNNRYGHPNKEVLNILGDSKIYRTDEDGSIIFKIKKNKVN